MSQTLQRPTNQIPVWLVFSGVVIGIVGATVKKHAENVGELLGTLGRLDAFLTSGDGIPGRLGIGVARRRRHCTAAAGSS